MDKNKPICNHSLLVPTQWNQPKPEPCEMITCACEQNASCPVCGFGWGTAPCECDREREENNILISSGILPKLVEQATSTAPEERPWSDVLDDIMVEYSEAWEKLADL